MMRKSKFWYWTLFCPKYCARSGATPNSARAAAIPPMRRMDLILSTRPRGRPPRAPGHRPTSARADRPTQFWMKNVHHEIHVVEQHPAALRQAFDMMWHEPARLERRHKMLRHPPHVRVRRP